MLRPPLTLGGFGRTRSKDEGATTMGNVTELNPWESVEFPWGSAVRKRNGEWTHIFLKPDGQEINLEQYGIKVILHDNGIEFI